MTKLFSADSGICPAQKISQEQLASWPSYPSFPIPIGPLKVLTAAWPILIPAAQNLQVPTVASLTTALDGSRDAPGLSIFTDVLR
jgi:hypothetical protein